MTTAEFKAMVAQYFAGELDRVERRAFDQLLEAKPDLAAAFDDEYDARTQALGLAALTSIAPELNECFSMATLERFVDGELDPEAAEWVERHLACPICRSQVEGLRANRAAVVVVGPWMRNGLVGLTAVAASLAIAVYVGPSLLGDPERAVDSVEGQPRWRTEAEPALDKRVEATVVLPPQYEVVHPTSGVSFERGEAAAVRLRSRSAQPLYYAVATGTSAAISQWRYPEADELGFFPNMATLSPGAEQSIPVEVVAPTSLWLVLRAEQANLDVLRSVDKPSAAPDRWVLPAAVRDASVVRWQINLR